MPYIKQEDREDIFFLDNSLDTYQISVDDITSAGELNFAITSIVDHYIRNSERGLCYAMLNEAIGVLECAKLELYRRIAAPYEDTKIEENGDVYTIGEK